MLDLSLWPITAIPAAAVAGSERPGHKETAMQHHRFRLNATWPADPTDSIQCQLQRIIDGVGLCDLLDRLVYECEERYAASGAPAEPWWDFSRALDAAADECAEAYEAFMAEGEAAEGD